MYKVNWKYLPFLLLLDVICSLLFFWVKLKPFPKKISKILVIRLDHIGDMLLTTPVFSSLKKEYPGAQVHVLGRSNTKPIIENNAAVDTFIGFNAPWFARGDEKDSIIAMIKRLRKERYDLIFELKGDPRNILLAAAVGSYRIGYAVRGLGFLLHRVVSWRGTKHITERYLDALRLIGCKKIMQKLELAKDKKSEAQVSKLFQKHNITKDDFVVCINPGVGAVEREWPLDYFAKLTDLISQEYKNAKILLVDVNDKKTKIVLEKVKHKDRVIDLSQNPPLKETIEIVRKSDVYIGLESMNMHIASAIGTPLIDIHSGVTRKEEWGPYQGKNIVLQNFVGFYAPLEKAQEAMKKIKPEQVLEAIKKLK